MDNRSNRKNWLEKNPKKVIGALVLLAVGGLAVVTEKLLARKNHGLIHPTGIQRSIKLREFNPLYRDVLVPNQEAMRMSDGLVQKPYVLRVDRQGFIMPAKIHDHPDLTIAFLGGSTTECVYVDEDNRFPYLVGRLLERQTHLKVNSYNAGRSGNNTLHCLNVLLNKVVNLKPDIVVLMENINDLAILMYDKTYWNDHPSRSPLMEKPPNFKTVGQDLEQTFHLVRDLTFPNLARELKKLSPFGRQGKGDEFHGVRGKKITIDQDLLVREFSLNLQTFINICRAREITPVLMTQASRLTESPDPLIRKSMRSLEVSQGITYTDFKGAFDRLNQTIRDVGAKNQVLVIDLAREIPPVKENIADVAHFNDRGSRLVAARIAAGLTPMITSLPKKPLSGN
ncbi:MAG: SGNH/GDSL hydrolase family protein [Proteobacteria bacterium]|nr:SGNH/GDSL hydrolase family protein [Pseudomonadota bacterium]MBU4447581.1 SGNH/GDSL hydrolase family protein [Pseudomonadota bacterium]